MYKIKIKDLKIFGYHGFYQSEKEKGQNFTINIEYIPYIEIDQINDDISKTIDYTLIVDVIKKEFNKKRFNLIESLSKYLMKKITSRFKFKYFKISIVKQIKIDAGFSIEINLENE